MKLLTTSMKTTVLLKGAYIGFRVGRIGTLKKGEGCGVCGVGKFRTSKGSWFASFEVLRFKRIWGVDFAVWQARRTPSHPTSAIV